jgi:hypothetical protein
MATRRRNTASPLALLPAAARLAGRGAARGRARRAPAEPDVVVQVDPFPSRVR